MGGCSDSKLLRCITHLHAAVTRRNPKFEWQDQFARSGIKGCTYSVGRAIADKWNGDTDRPYYSAEMLAEVTGYSVRQVRRALRALQEGDWIRQHSRGGRRGEVSFASRWTLTIPNVTWVSPNVTPVSPQRDMGVTPVDPGLDPGRLDPPHPLVVHHLEGSGLRPASRGEVECPWLMPPGRVCAGCPTPSACGRDAEVHTVNGATHD